MASVYEYCEKLSTQQLRSLLRDEYDGKGAMPVEAILDVCRALSERDPSCPTIEEAVRLLCASYL